MKHLFLFLFITLSACTHHSGVQTIVHSESAKELLLGEHLFTNQWMNNIYSGVAVASEDRGLVFLSAYQESIQGFTYIDGIVTEIGDKYFKVKGKINIFETSASRISSGYKFTGRNNCVGEGIFTFRISGKRKYWRMKRKTEFCKKRGERDQEPRYDDKAYYLDIFFGPPNDKFGPYNRN